MQLKFTCPECGRSGVTPEVETSKAVALALKELHMHCPACSAAVAVTETLASVLWKSQQQLAGALVETAGQSLSTLKHHMDEARAARRDARKDHDQEKKQDSEEGPADGSQPIRSGTDSPSVSAD